MTEEGRESVRRRLAVAAAAELLGSKTHKFRKNDMCKIVKPESSKLGMQVMVAPGRVEKS